MIARLTLFQRDNSAAPRNCRQHFRRQRPPSATLDDGNGFFHHRVADFDSLRFSRLQIDADEEFPGRADSKPRNIHFAIQMRRQYAPRIDAIGVHRRRARADGGAVKDRAEAGKKYRQSNFAGDFCDDGQSA